MVSNAKLEKLNAVLDSDKYIKITGQQLNNIYQDFNEERLKFTDYLPDNLGAINYHDRPYPLGLGPCIKRRFYQLIDLFRSDKVKTILFFNREKNKVVRSYKVTKSLRQLIKNNYQDDNYYITDQFYNELLDGNHWEELKKRTSTLKLATLIHESSEFFNKLMDFFSLSNEELAALQHETIEVYFSSLENNTTAENGVDTDYCKPFPFLDYYTSCYISLTLIRLSALLLTGRWQPSQEYINSYKY